MVDKFEKKWQKSQIAGWKNDKKRITSFFHRFDIEIAAVYTHITNLDYTRMQTICYLLSKIVKSIKICDYLDRLEREEHADVDAIKIFFLISHAEITMNNLGLKDNKKELVRKFFVPVAEKYGLKYKIRVGLDSINITRGMYFSDILYKIRCEYAHEGNYTGKIFNKRKDKENVYNSFHFKSNNEDFYGECILTYKEFLDIYMEALVENIKTFSDYGKAI
jgi:hypothetical protein